MTDKEDFVDYDDRRKELTHTTRETREAKINEEIVGEVVLESKGVYNEAGIRKIVDDLRSRKAQLEHSIAQYKLTDKPEMTEDLELLKNQLIKLQKIDLAEKNELKLKELEENLTQVNKSLTDIKEEIGTRLNL